MEYPLTADKTVPTLLSLPWVKLCGCAVIPPLAPGGTPAADSHAVRLLLPLPPSSLSPNARGAWYVAYPAQKQYRTDCTWIVKAARRGVPGLPWSAARASIHWLVRDPNRRRDRDNCIASLKVGLDTLTGMFVVDDSQLRIELAEPFFVKVEPRDEGVEIMLSEVVG